MAKLRSPALPTAAPTLTHTPTATGTTTSTPSSTPPMRTIARTHDGLQRLIGAVESPGTAYAYQYDLAGNRTQVAVNGTTTQQHTYDSANQVVGGTYDPAGNLTGDGTSTYSYDALGRLTAATSGAQGSTYSYNGDGTLVGQASGGVTTGYAQDLAGGQSQVLAIATGSGAGASTVDQLWGTDRLAALNPATGVRAWYGYDGQGTARQLLNDAGHVTASANYDPYGSPEGAALPSPFGYTGELTDPATGSQYLRARWYRPGQGSLLGVDPLLAQTGQAYSYANDNPVNMADPSELNPCDSYLLNGTCRVVGTLAGDAGSAIHDAKGKFIGTWDHLTGGAAKFVRQALLRDLFAVNGLLVKVAQGGFADGVNDGLIEFANGVAGLPGTVKGHLDKLGYYAQHPGDAAPLVKGLVIGVIKSDLSQMSPVGLAQGQIQLLRGPWDVVQALRHSAACGTLAHELGYQLTRLVLQGAAAELGGKFLGALADAIRGEELFVARAEGDRATVRDLGGCINGCFPAGTMVATPGGTAPIEGLHVGDTVLAEDTKTGAVSPRRVEAVIADGVQPLLALDLADGSRLSATPNHLFYVDGGPGIAHPEWLAAADLQAGDRLRIEEGRDITITALRYHTGYAHVYTLTVAHDHTFFVGPDAVLVHNCDKLTSQEVTAQYDDNLYEGRWYNSSGGKLTDAETLADHYNRHGQPLGKDLREYVGDAEGFWDANEHLRGRGNFWEPVRLENGETGFRHRGQPGGVYTSDGKPVTFWYPGQGAD